MLWLIYGFTVPGQLTAESFLKIFFYLFDSRAMDFTKTK